MSAGLALLAALAAPASAQNVGGRASMSSVVPAATCPDLGWPPWVARVVAEGRVQFVESADADPASPSLARACRDMACGGMNVSFSGVYRRGG